MFFNQRAHDHIENDPRVERFIQLAARLATEDASEDEIVNALLNEGALMHEAVNAMRAGAILSRG